MRKPDSDISGAMRDSYVFERSSNLAENAIDP